MTEDVIGNEYKNVANEILVVGSFYKQPDLGVSHLAFVRSKYDFYDLACRFFFDCYELMYKTFSQTFNEVKVNTFMAQDEERLRLYKEYGGYKQITQWMSLSDPEDFDNYFETLKKFSLLREYFKKGYSVERIVKHKKFNELKALDIYKLVRSKVDQISTVILSNQESSVLNENVENDIKSYIIKPQEGLHYPWPIVHEMFKGCRLGKAVLNGFLSNEGKTRILVMLMSYIALYHNKPVLILSNEMSEEDLRSCLITTVVNNECFREMHGVDIKKPEAEIVLGKYRDKRGTFMEKKADESHDEFYKRLERDSEEYNKILKVGKWIDDRGKKLIFFKDVSNDYSDSRLDFEIKKHRLINNVEYMCYDTLKGYKTDDWMTVKQTFTKLREIVGEINVWLFCNFQLTDDSVFADIFEMSSNNISNSKQIKHATDYMLLGKRIDKQEYHKYVVREIDAWGESKAVPLDPDKKYFAMKPEKNRGGNKLYYPLFVYDLDYNTWDNIGSIERS